MQDPCQVIFVVLFGRYSVLAFQLVEKQGIRGIVMRWSHRKQFFVVVLRGWRCMQVLCQEKFLIIVGRLLCKLFGFNSYFKELEGYFSRGGRTLKIRGIKAFLLRRYLTAFKKGFKPLTLSISYF